MSCILCRCCKSRQRNLFLRCCKKDGKLQKTIIIFFKLIFSCKVIVFEINRTTLRHRKVREFAMPGLPQYLSILGGKLCVGYPSGFRMWNFADNSQQREFENFRSTIFVINLSFSSVK